MMGELRRTDEEPSMNSPEEIKAEEKRLMREEVEQVRQDQRKRHRALGWFLNLYLDSPMPVKIIFLVFGMLYSPAMVQNLVACLRAPKSGKLHVVAGPDFIYVYPLAVWGFIFCVLDYYLEGQQLIAPLTWLYLGLLLFTIVTIGLDFRGGSWLGVIVVSLAIVAAVGWWGEHQKIPVIELIGKGIRWFELDEFPRRMVFATSLFLLLIYIGVYIRMNLIGVLKIEGNYVQVWTLASRSPKDTRASFSLVPDFDDLNELLLGFSCRLNLKSKSPRVQSHEFPNMPGGPVVEQIATHLLNAQEVELTQDPFDQGGGEDDE